MTADYNTLKKRQRDERDNWPTNLSLRVHRALSWLNRAEQEDDPDSRFIFLWIAFNAAYATDIDSRVFNGEKAVFNAFFEKLRDLDVNDKLGKLVWEKYPSAIRVLLDNPYVFADFWAHQNGQLTEAEWQDKFTKARHFAQMSLAKQDAAGVLAIVFSRIYTLRNQIIHGGATWQGQVNRDQIRDCMAILDDVVPTLIELMMDNPNTLWGDPAFPVVEAS